MNYKKLALSVFTATVTIMTVVSPVFAEQYGQYGNGSTPSDLTVNKKVRTPVSPFTFEENLTEANTKYAPDTDVVFQISVTNSGNQTFEEVKVEDLLPEHIVTARVADEFNGSYNSSDRRLTFYLKDVKAGETKTVEVTAKLAKNGFPSDKNVVCLTNKAEVRSEDRYDDDTAQFCVQLNVLGTTTLPQAGLEDYLPLLPFLAIGIAGMTLLTKKRVV